MATVCGKTRPPNIANMLSIKNSRMLAISVLENIFVESECFIYKKDRWPFIFHETQLDQLT